ncbi:4Fe-4S dicluster domain-containing protein [Desulfohalobium retbaense]|uniref:Nitrite and sulphite reductase 4Fe-4S region n=1 Tax=Desulfohalobium retbaense (strain ATCC 49708 / DSM 5692 / JCM 16813 / HR100) TaxID=485915 RepID=C8X2B9_DESRD|nr:4Fe-4S dicluster domain-containing protein [Desulfohalobium retbaense]ACV68566.1 nitrite and sulphite reductase 4Fe-4S region [Desulfohalobium retbaense DSM 5692]
MQDSTTEINICRGVRGGGCPRTLIDSPGIADRMAGAVQATPWPGVCQPAGGSPAKAHDRLRISVAGCPNGCSRPPIADIGFIRAVRPRCQRTSCTLCGNCLAACREGALHFDLAGVCIDPLTCMQCGACQRVCTERALEGYLSGWRVMIGGRLGRHPELALELPGLFSNQQALDLLSATAAWWAEHWSPRTRLGAKRAALAATLVAQGHVALFHPGPGSLSEEICAQP